VEADGPATHNYKNNRWIPEWRVLNDPQKRSGVVAWSVVVGLWFVVERRSGGGEGCAGGSMDRGWRVLCGAGLEVRLVVMHGFCVGGAGLGFGGWLA